MGLVVKEVSLNALLVPLGVLYAVRIALRLFVQVACLTMATIKSHRNVLLVSMGLVVKEV